MWSNLKDLRLKFVNKRFINVRKLFMDKNNHQEHGIEILMITSWKKVLKRERMSLSCILNEMYG